MKNNLKSLIAYGYETYGDFWQKPLAAKLDVSPSYLNGIVKKNIPYGGKVERAFALVIRNKLRGQKIAETKALKKMQRDPAEAAQISEAIHAPVLAVENVGPTLSVRRSPKLTVVEVPVADDPVVPTDADYVAETLDLFSVIDDMVQGAIKGVEPCVILSGPPGLGKTFSVERALNEAATNGKNVFYLKGKATAPGIYQTLYAARDGGIVLIDDCDSVFKTEDAMNILKVALSGDGQRRMTWATQARWLGTSDEIQTSPGEKFPREFMFSGSVIFITNLDLEAAANANNAMAEHFGALISRAVYIRLTVLDSLMAKLAWVKYGIDKFGILGDLGIPAEGLEAIKAFLTERAEQFQEISFRLVSALGRFYLSGPNWQKTAAVTKFRRGEKL